MIHPEITLFKELHKVDLTIGLEVVVSPDCPYYEPQYDEGMKYMVTGLSVDAGGLNISLSDSVPVDHPMHSRFLQEGDGYRWGDINPVQRAVESEDSRDADRYRAIRSRDPEDECFLCGYDGLDVHTGEGLDKVADEERMKRHG